MRLSHLHDEVIDITEVKYDNFVKRPPWQETATEFFEFLRTRVVTVPGCMRGLHEVAQDIRYGSDIYIRFQRGSWASEGSIKIDFSDTRYQHGKKQITMRELSCTVTISGGERIISHSVCLHKLYGDLIAIAAEIEATFPRDYVVKMDAGKMQPEYPNVPHHDLVWFIEHEKRKRQQAQDEDIVKVATLEHNQSEAERKAKEEANRVEVAAAPRKKGKS